MATQFFKSVGKDINRSNKNIGKMFKKSTGDTAKLFKKGGDIDKLFGKGSPSSKLLGDISRGLEQGADTADLVAKYGNQVLGNPAVKAFVATQPELQPFYAGALAGTKAIGIAGKAGHQLSGLTKQKNYSGDAGQVVSQVLERSKGLAKTGMEGAKLYNQYV
jgi:hypothetical protein